MFSEKKFPRRDNEFHHDFSIQNINIEERKTISVYPKSLATDWTLVANMQRKFKASLSENLGYEYLLTTTEYMNSEYIPAKYRRMYHYPAKKYILFKLED